MRIIIDSNILFSALIKDSKTRKLILEYNGFFLFPSYILEEMEKHERELYTKSGLNEQDFERLLNLILKKVSIIPNEALRPHRQKALEIVKTIDPNDAVFIACALAHPNSIIWSDDKKLKKQERVKVLNTKVITKIL